MMGEYRKLPAFIVALCCVTPQLVHAQSLQSSFTDIIKEAKKKEGVTLPEVRFPEVVEQKEDSPIAAPLAEATEVEADGVSGEIADPANSDPSLDDAAVLPDEPLVDGFEPSYGDVDLSLMFPEADMINMRKILRFYESKELASVQAPQQTDEYDEYISQIIGDIDGDGKEGEQELKPMLLPAYYLGTILYRTPRRWSLWLNGKKFSANEEIPGLEIAAINASRVDFIWKPERLREIVTAMDEKDKSAYGNRSAGEQTVSTDVENGLVHFSLRRNQTFNAADMEIYEGKFRGGIDPFTHEPEEAEASEGEGGSSGEATARRFEAIDSERALMEELVNNANKLQNVIPKRKDDASSEGASPESASSDGASVE